MTTGSSLDIVARVKGLIPKRWFSWVAPYREALLGGIADNAAWGYNFILYARSQSRLATAYGIWLDILAFDFLGRFLIRNGLLDDVFRAVIKSTILQERVTRQGMINAITILTGTVPWIFEPWNTYDTGAYSGTIGSGAVQYGSMGYGVGRGGYGNMQLPGQTFIKVTRQLSSGVPGVDGYSGVIAGYGAGSIEYAGALVPLRGVTNEIINQIVSMTKPTGTTMWMAIGAPPTGSVGNGMPRRPAIMNNVANSQNIAII